MRPTLRKIHIKILGTFAVFIVCAILFAVIWRGLPQTQKDRAPSSVLYNEDGEIVMVDMSIKDLESRRDMISEKGGTDEDSDRDSGDERGDRPSAENRALPRHGDVVLSSGKPKELIFDRHQLTGLLGEDIGQRARRVVFHRQAFVRFMNTSARTAQFDLFEDVHLKVRFTPPSLYSTNAGLYSGTIDGDPNGKVRLFVAGKSAQGTFETATRTFRLIDGGSGQHFVVEERQAPRAK